MSMTCIAKCQSNSTVLCIFRRYALILSEVCCHLDSTRKYLNNLNSDLFNLVEKSLNMSHSHINTEFLLQRLFEQDIF